ncbi:hypothetical protein ABHI18_011836 [Aspergillus niger]
MREDLKKNICSLESYGTMRSDIDLKSINHYLLPELQYSCRYWIHHLARSKDPMSQVNDILTFLKEHFLHWLESMSILGITSEAIIAVNSLLQLTKWEIQDTSSNEIYVFLLDARRFILKFAQIVDTAPLQLYSSGLIFAPHRSLIRETFERELPAWLSRGPKVEEYWDPEMQTLEGHSDSVRSVAFSGDGQLLASGSDDKTIKLWDAATGALKNTLEGHSGSVSSVAFAGDSQLLASGSADKTIKLWDAATGAFKHTLEGHSSSIITVAFSGDGQLLASGSADKIIKLWHAATGTLKHTLEGHSNKVSSVAFSGDGQLLASSSHDKTIKLWDAATGAHKYTLEGHSDRISSVAFSDNGQLLASGSWDKTIKLWDAATGALKYILEGHSDWISSVAFSGDGQLLASGSHDKTIKLWDAATGALKHDISTDSIATDVKFSERLRLLITNIGSFDIRNYYESFSISSEKVMEISLVAGRWVTVQGQRELWLPPNYDSRRSKVMNSTIALGSTSGRVAIIAFSVM